MEVNEERKGRVRGGDGRVVSSYLDFYTTTTSL